jgi:hypothetical protein
MPPARPITNTNITRENQQKSLDLTVDSLKLYITLSTVAIAALLGLYKLSDEPRNVGLLWLSIVCLLACAITSVININMFINSVYDDNYNTRAPGVRAANFLAIVFFVLGIGSAIIYIMSNRNNSPKKNDHIQLMIGEKFIDLPRDSAAVEYKVDTSLHIQSLQINPPKISVIQFRDSVRCCCCTHRRPRHHRPCR